MLDTLALKPLVTIVIPCYNHAQFVEETIQSVIDQDYDNIELIIIDDGSKDNSVEVIKGMIPACEKRFVRFEFRHRPNKGLSATLNESLLWCKGAYFFPLASDDIIYPTIIRKEVMLLESNPKYAMCHTHAESIFTQPDVAKYQTKHYEFEFHDLINKNQIYAPTAMIKMEVLKELNGFDESLYMEDWDLWLRLTHKGYKIAFINEVLAFYRQHENNSYKNHDKMEEASDLILKKWKGHKSYASAIKNEKLRRFDLYAEIDKPRALKYLPYALCHPSEKKSYLGVIKLLVPTSLYPVIRKLIKRL